MAGEQGQSDRTFTEVAEQLAEWRFWEKIDRLAELGRRDPALLPLVADLFDQLHSFMTGVELAHGLEPPDYGAGHLDADALLQGLESGFSLAMKPDRDEQHEEGGAHA